VLPASETSLTRRDALKGAVGLAALGVVVGTLGIANTSHETRIWDEVGGEPAE